MLTKASWPSTKYFKSCAGLKAQGIFQGGQEVEQLLTSANKKDGIQDRDHVNDDDDDDDDDDDENVADMEDNHMIIHIYV